MRLSTFCGLHRDVRNNKSKGINFFHKFLFVRVCHADCRVSPRAAVVGTGTRWNAPRSPKVAAHSKAAGAGAPRAAGVAARWMKAGGMKAGAPWDPEAGAPRAAGVAAHRMKAGAPRAAGAGAPGAAEAGAPQAAGAGTILKATRGSWTLNAIQDQNRKFIISRNKCKLCLFLKLPEDLSARRYCHPPWPRVPSPCPPPEAAVAKTDLRHHSPAVACWESMSRTWPDRKCVPECLLLKYDGG
jgi:hypothetical protein